MPDAQPPNPYSEASRGAQQVETETQELAEAYRRGFAGLESQTAHQANQQLIAELLERQALRQAPGQTYLAPVRTRLPTPTPPPDPAPPPAESPLQVWLDGQPVERTAPQELEEDAGMTQMLDEAEHLFQVRHRAWSGAYLTPEEWRQLQAAENALVERHQWREATGQRFIIDDICRKRPRA